MQFLKKTDENIIDFIPLVQYQQSVKSLYYLSLLCKDSNRSLHKKMIPENMLPNKHINISACASHGSP